MERPRVAARVHVVEATYVSNDASGLRFISAPLMGQVITFYSYKGGTGRSMAMANVAWILASHGKRVLAMDWVLGCGSGPPRLQIETI